MTHPTPTLNQLTQAERMFEAGKFDEAYELLNDLENKEGTNLLKKVSNYVLKLEFLFQQGQYKEVLTLAKKTYKESLGLGKNPLVIDSLMWMARALIFLDKLDEASKVIKQGEGVLNDLPQELSIKYKRSKAFMAFVKGYYYKVKDDIDKAIEYLEHSLALRESLGIKHEIAESLCWIAILAYQYKGELGYGLKIAEQSLVFAKESAKKFYIAFSLTSLAGAYTYQGEIDRCIMQFEQSLAIFKELNNKRMIAITLNNTGEKYRMKGDLDRALEYLEESLEILQELGNLRDIASTHDFLIQILIDIGNLKRAESLLQNMAQINNQLQDKHTNSVYLFDKALLLKTSLRARNRAKAEKILNLLLEDKDLDYELTIRTLLNLCELHLIELQITNDAEVLDDINPLISRLLKNAEKSHSYWVLSETYLLQAKLSLLMLDVKKTQRFLTQAQMVAESHGLRRLAMQISHEHDEVINKLDMWKKLKESDSTYSERMMLTGLNEQMEGMVRKRIIEFPEFSDEEPILLLILSEGGRPFFSQSFVEDKAFESHIFGGFLTTIDYFIREMFSEGLDRASFGEYTLLMKSLTPFFICYIFRGESYHASQKIKNFTENIHKKDEIWQKLLESFQGSKSVHVNDIPPLDSLIKETFIPKK